MHVTFGGSSNSSSSDKDHCDQPVPTPRDLKLIQKFGGGRQVALAARAILRRKKSRVLKPAASDRSQTQQALLRLLDEIEMLSALVTETEQGDLRERLEFRLLGMKTDALELERQPQLTHEQVLREDATLMLRIEESHSYAESHKDGHSKRPAQTNAHKCTTPERLDKGHTPCMRALPIGQPSRGSQYILPPVDLAATRDSKDRCEQFFHPDTTKCNDAHSWLARHRKLEEVTWISGLRNYSLPL